MPASIPPSRKAIINLGLLTGFGSALAALLALALLAQSVAGGVTQEIDDSLRLRVHEHATPGLTAVMHFITGLGSWPFYVSAMLTIVPVFLAARWFRAARLLILTMAGAALLDTSLKLLFRRARPTPFFGLATPDTYSFPSGHALSALCFYGITASILAARTRSRRLRALVWTSSAILILAVGFSRVYLGVHYPSDVLAGYAAALVWVTAVSWIDRLLQKSGKGYGVAGSTPHDRIESETP
jgi:undecaprenyl-diphosphatase